MSWRNQGITGSNNIPLGKARRFGGESDDGSFGRDDPGDDFASNSGDRDLKRGRSPEPSKSLFFYLSRFASNITHMLTYLPSRN